MVFTNPARGVCVAENTEHFDVEYDSREDFQDAVVMLAGMVEYREL